MNTRNKWEAELVKQITNHPDFRRAQSGFVSVYRTRRCYGGPEEGGWWYDRTMLMGSVGFPSMEAAEQYFRVTSLLVSEMNEQEHPERIRAMASLPDEDTCWTSDSGEGFIPTGWDDGGYLWVTTEDFAGSVDNSNDPVPHYC